ncbi:MAG: hypothetical protein FWC64_00410 [Treponema sp.]|nr:hypothetical protein [Treponema sp.]
MTIEQTVQIPPGRRFFVDVPPEVPVGKAILTITAVLENKDLEYTLANCANKLDAGEVRAKLQSLQGSLGKNAFGNLDGVAYQRKVREEWGN